MASLKITNTTGLTLGSSISGVREVEFNCGVVEKVAGADGEPTQTDPVDFGWNGTATFENASAINAFLGASEGNLVVTGRVWGGASSKTITAKNCIATGMRGSLPTRQARDIGTYRCDFRLRPGSSDTLDSMLSIS